MVELDFYFEWMLRRLFQEKPSQHLRHTVCCVQTCASVFCCFFVSWFRFICVLRWNQRPEKLLIQLFNSNYGRNKNIVIFVISGKQPIFSSVMYRGRSIQFFQITEEEKKHSPTYSSWCLARFVLSASAARPVMELNGISFAFGSFSPELFSS